MGILYKTLGQAYAGVVSPCWVEVAAKLFESVLFAQEMFCQNNVSDADVPMDGI